MHKHNPLVSARLQKQVLHKRQGDSGSYCIILDLKASNELILFMASGTKYHILGAN